MLMEIWPVKVSRKMQFTDCIRCRAHFLEAKFGEHINENKKERNRFRKSL